MAGLPYQIGDHPRMEPEPDRGPCAECEGERARQSIHDHFYDMKHDDAIPSQARCEFEEKWGPVVVEIAAWAAEYAEDVARRDDNEACERHAPGPCE